MNIIEDFHKDNNGLATYYYIIIGLCNTNIYGVSLLSSLNTFIALVHPLRYNIWFSKIRIAIYITIIFWIGSIYGIAMTFFHPYYLYLHSSKGYLITFKSVYVTYCVMIYSIIIHFPIAILSTIMNIISAVKFAKYYSTMNSKKSQNISMFVYTIVNFFTFSIVVAYTWGKIINFVTVQSDLVESIAQQIAYWNIDLTTFGLFYIVLFLYSPLRDLLKFTTV